MGKTAFEAKRGTLFYFDPDDLIVIDDPSHPLYDPRVEKPLTESFIRSLVSKGVIEPVVVRKNGEEAEVVDGRRRVRGAREANKRLAAEGAPTISVPAVLHRSDDTNTFAMSILLNEQREDDEPLAKAHKANRLMAMGQTESDVADIFGVTVQTIKSWVGLLDLHPKVQKAVAEGRLGAIDAVKKLGTLSREDQADALAELATATGGSKAIRKAVEKRGGNAGARPIPGKRQLRRILDLDHNGDRSVFTERERVLIEWLIGETTHTRLGERIPGMLPLLKISEKPAKKPKKLKAPAVTEHEATA